MINVNERGDGIIPIYRDTQLTKEEKHGFVPIISEAQLDYCKRELGRPLDEFERGVLQNMAVDLERANKTLRKKGMIKMIHPVEDLIQIFIDRVRRQEAAAATRKIMVGYTGGKRDAS
jgi:hypothetical protein